MMNLECVIGIEIHVELKTKTKMFSSAPNAFNQKPNTLVNEYDLALPGTMPTVNKKAIELGIIAATVLNCQIDDLLIFDRKNYFYADLPKGFQITQDKKPLGKNGFIEFEIDQKKYKIKNFFLKIIVQVTNLLKVHNGVTSVDFY